MFFWLSQNLLKKTIFYDNKQWPILLKALQEVVIITWELITKMNSKLELLVSATSLVKGD